MALCTVLRRGCGMWFLGHICRSSVGGNSCASSLGRWIKRWEVFSVSGWKIPKPNQVVNGLSHQSYFMLFFMGFKLLLDPAWNFYFLQESHRHGQLSPEFRKHWRLIAYPTEIEPGAGGWGVGIRDRENILKTVIKEPLPGQNIQANTITHHLL